MEGGTCKIMTLFGAGIYQRRGNCTQLINDPAASSGVSSCLLGRHSVLDTESSRVFWIPAFAGMTNSRQAAGNEPHRIQVTALLEKQNVEQDGPPSCVPGISKIAAQGEASGRNIERS